MKRTGFARLAPKPATQSTYTPRPRAVAVARADVSVRMCVPVPKAAPLRDEGYRRLVAALPCVLCGIDGFSNACHGDEGKGMQIKSDDRTCYPACVTRPGKVGCHDLIGTMREFTRELRREYELLWAVRTRQQLRALAESDAKARVIVERVIGL